MPESKERQYLRLVFDNMQDTHTEWCIKPEGIDCFKNTGCGNCAYLVREDLK